MATRSPNKCSATPVSLDDGWQVSGAEQSGLDPKILSTIVESIENDEHRDFHSLLIAKDGRLIFEAYFHGYDLERLHDIRSAGKSFTSTLIGIGIDQGVLASVDAPMLPYFTRFQPHRNLDGRKEAIRLRDLLMMMSGLDADDNDPDTPGCEDNMLKSKDWIRYGLDLPMAEAPGLRWVYAGVNTMLLAGVLEAAGRRPVIDSARDWLFEPLGIETLHWETSPRGTVVGQGFLSLRGRDQLKLGQLYLNGGMWNGRRIVSKDWVLGATKSQVPIPNEKHASYGYQWWRIAIYLESESIDCYFASGNGGNKIYVLPSLNMVVGMASSAYLKPYMHTRSHGILRQVIKAAI